MTTGSTRGRKKRKANRGSFRKGPDPRRHIFTAEERRRGGLSCAAKFTCHGRWHPDWWERCARKTKNEKGEWSDEPKEAVGCTAAGDECPF